MASSSRNIAVLLTLIAFVSSYCPNGWERFNDSCYLFVYLKGGIWQAASNYCSGLNAHLVVVESARENDFIKHELTKLHPGAEDQFWTAGTDLKNETIWEWANTGDSFEVTFWHPGEPNQNGGEEDCLTYYPRYNFDWNDEHCNRVLPFICELEDPIDNPGSVVG